MHARMSIGGQILMASDSPPGHFHKPQGFSVSLTVSDPAEAEKKFKALCEGGSRQHAVRQDFLLERVSAWASTSSAFPGWSTARSKACELEQSSARRVLPARPVHRRELAPAQQQQPRGQSAAAADPDPHRRRIGLQHELRRLPARHRSGRAGRSSARRGSRGPRAASRRCARSAPCSAPACRPTGRARRSPRARRTGAPPRTDRETGRPVRPGFRGCGHRRAGEASARSAVTSEDSST